MKPEAEANKRHPSIVDALIPITFLIVLLVFSRVFFESDSSYGPNQIALILSAGVGIIIGIKNKFSWKELETAMVEGISLSMGAVFILLAVGALVGTWFLGGIVPTMIYYGLKIMSPSYFYVSSAVICLIVALGTGSSWTTASTIGVALIGIAGIMDLHLGIAAGAIISGSYFGDKVSPLSDTTNLAPAMAGTDLFSHIRHMLWTTIPSIVIACIIFFFLGISKHSGGDTSQLQEMLTLLDSQFNIGVHMLLPPVIVIILVMKKVPAFPAIMIGALIGGLFAVLFQAETVAAFVGVEEPNVAAMLKGVWQALFGGYSGTTGNEYVDKLISRGGMAGMLNTVWLIMSAMMFGAVMEKTGILALLARGILSLAGSTGSLVTATLATCFGMNIIASDQYIAIVLPGRMFRAEFERRGLHPKNLSRCLEDSGTLTSPLIPWNTCGAYMAQTLGVATAVYLPFCFFNLLNPLISAFYGFTGFTIVKADSEEVEA